MTFFEYLNLKREIPKCPYCEKDCKPRKRSFTLTCTDKKCMNIMARERRHSSETIEIIREKRVDYLKKKTGKTAWERRARGEMSYLENWFQEEVIIKHDLQRHHQIITEHCVKGYFIDFAFLDKMIAVEIDGRCHFDKNMNRREGDHKKDACLSAEGWQVIRMNFFDIRNNPNDLVEKFLSILKDGNETSLDWIGQIRYRDYKINKSIRSNRMITSVFQEERQKRNQEKIKKLMSSDIDFKKFGWIQQASEVIEISPQKTRAWIKKNLPSVLENSFKRK
jgi:very-short-patch-repair endonuclease